MHHRAVLRAVAPTGLFLAAFFAATPVWATESADGAHPSPDACRKNVHAMGASMSDAEEKKLDWGLAYHFVIRTNGIDYDVLCDAKTGLVKDVTPRGGAAESQ
jgi:hypothetical protein